MFYYRRVRDWIITMQHPWGDGPYNRDPALDVRVFGHSAANEEGAVCPYMATGWYGYNDINQPGSITHTEGCPSVGVSMPCPTPAPTASPTTSLPTAQPTKLPTTSTHSNAPT